MGKIRSQQWLLESNNKNVGNHAFFRDNKKSVKIQRMYGNVFLNASLIFSQKCVTTPNILFGF